MTDSFTTVPGHLGIAKMVAQPGHTITRRSRVFGAWRDDRNDVAALILRATGHRVSLRWKEEPTKYRGGYWVIGLPIPDDLHIAHLHGLVGWDFYVERVV